MTAEPAMSNLLREKVAKAFWHRTRRCWVPLTREELLGKVLSPEDEVMPVLRGLIRHRLVVVGYVSGHRTSTPIFEITPGGIDALFRTAQQVAA